MKLAELFHHLLHQQSYTLPKDFLSSDKEITNAYESLVDTCSKEQKLTPADLEALNSIKPSNLQDECFNISVYAQLLPFMKFACKAEGYYGDAVEKALNLTVMFGNANKAMVYLMKFGRYFSNSKQPIHDACQFNLPKGKWNVKLWRELAYVHLPNPAFTRVFVHADKIEMYVAENYEQLSAAQKKITEAHYHDYLAGEYDKIVKMENYENDYLQRALHTEKIQIALNKEIQSTLNVWIRMRCALPTDGKLTAKNLLAMKQFMKTNECQRKEQEIKTQALDRYTKKIIDIYQKKKITQDKNSYISARLKQDAKIIAANVKTRCEKIFSAKSDINTLISYAEKVCYKNGNKFPEIVPLFFGNSMPESGYEKYLQIKPQDNAQHIPNILIDGNEVKHDGFYLQKLSPFDPRAAILGKLTGCCQYLGGPGEEYVEHGIESEYGGFYVLYKQRGQVADKNDLVIAQTWAWRGTQNKIVFDSIETHRNFSIKYEQVVYDFFTLLADKLVTLHSVPEVMVGTKGQTPERFQCVATRRPEFPVDYSKYCDSDRRDSKNQCVLANDLFSLWKSRKNMIQTTNEQMKLKMHNPQ